ncbi:MAG: class I SAM-dependent methyltransferase, partial [Candidatus Binataceae bacterium]
ELDRPFSYLTGRKPGRLLEVGCGAGDWLRIAGDLGWRADGVDFDPDAVANARSTGASVHSGQLADQNFPDQSFDLILMSHVIEHVHDPIGLLRECYRLLKDDGLLVVWTPNSDGRGHARFGRHWTGLHPPYHLWLLNPMTLDSMARRARFAEAKIFTTIRNAAGNFALGRSIERVGSGNTVSVRERLDGYGFALLERLKLVTNPSVGEELIAELRK